MIPDNEDPRVKYAIERTLLAWIRTGLALMGFGFVVARFGLFLRELEAIHLDRPQHANTGLSLWLGTALIVVGVVVLVLAALDQLILLRRIHVAPPYTVRSWAAAIGVAFILAALGVAMVIYLNTAGR